MKNPKNKKIFGLELILNLYNCDLKILKSKKKILEFPRILCKLIKMNLCGSPIIRRTGKGDLIGYSLVQFIETSSIVVHTCEPIKETYLNIFSCKLFDANKTAEFSEKYFGAKKIRKKVVIR